MIIQGTKEANLMDVLARNLRDSSGGSVATSTTGMYGKALPHGGEDRADRPGAR